MESSRIKITIYIEFTVGHIKWKSITFPCTRHCKCTYTPCCRKWKMRHTHTLPAPSMSCSFMHKFKQIQIQMILSSILRNQIFPELMTLSLTIFALTSLLALHCVRVCCFDVNHVYFACWNIFRCLEQRNRKCNKHRQFDVRLWNLCIVVVPRVIYIYPLMCVFVLICIYVKMSVMLCWICVFVANNK